MSINEFPALLDRQNDHLADALRRLQKEEVANLEEATSQWFFWL